MAVGHFFSRIKAEPNFLYKMKTTKNDGGKGFFSEFGQNGTKIEKTVELLQMLKTMGSFDAKCPILKNTGKYGQKCAKIEISFFSILDFPLCI